MKMSRLFAPTLREAPAEAEIASHKLLLRAGFIRRSTAGIYTYLPLGWRVIRKIEQIVREEMNAAGGQEIMLPVVQPAELWQATGRWELYGSEMFRLRDRHSREFCLGPTHEEIITELVKGDVHSYKQLPLLLYQIQNKYRDERRPRFGLMRGREFIMMDLYSFDRSPESARESYARMYTAYEAIFRRCGLSCRAVEADAGAIGGSGGTHEFMALAEAGEAEVVFCPDCAYAANTEKAECAPPPEAVPAADAAEAAPPRTEVATPGARTIEEVSALLGLPPERFLKTLVYKGDGQYLVVVLRGDRTANEVKINNCLGPFRDLRLADEDDLAALLPCGAGFAGPVGLPAARLAVDSEAAVPAAFVCGANRPDAHWRDVVPGRDFPLPLTADLRLARAGEPCPRCGAALGGARGIEVGQVFNLGQKYSEALSARFLNEDGKSQPFYMGCYGIGVSRAMAAAVEQRGDESGIIWPPAIAPYHCVVVPVNEKDPTVTAAAMTLYDKLWAAGVETVLDDRPERLGVKFKDADLIGFPLRLVVSAAGLAQGQIELKRRRTGDLEFIPLAEAVARVRLILEEN
ncbi:MAG: proline--tRNA ligase [Gracilibacteraceae bacterium]|jgi:prolyl-tRNA synthetase|nr:proline--tRNA ligase [Gracilibacteraceae bacterium]